MYQLPLLPRHTLRRLTPAELPALLALCCGNPQFYQFHPPMPTEESLLQDMSALPPGTSPEDKYFLGIFRQGRLEAVLDLVLHYPGEDTAYIGFFMVERSLQGQGLGGEIIRALLTLLKSQGYARLRLAVDEGNPQSLAFWQKCGFALTGEKCGPAFRYLPMERRLTGHSEKECIIMQKPTLLVLAAGMGSRYGGLKQIDPLGPHGEIIIDYSIHDAILAGFGKVVFVIKRELADTFHQVIGSRFADKLTVEYAFQELSDCPDSNALPPERVKPWGTGHAVYAARTQIQGPFAAINADDFLGRDTFLQLGRFCAEHCDGSHGAMVGFRLGNTLSENGTVSRGVCQVRQGFLTSVTEHTAIRRDADGRILCQGEAEPLTLAEDTPVSMNVWALHSDLFPALETVFARWLKEGGGDPLKREFYLPAFVDGLVQSGDISVQVLDTASQWYGVTNRADKEGVQQALTRLHEEGVYPPLR